MLRHAVFSKCLAPMSWRKTLPKRRHKHISTPRLPTVMATGLRYQQDFESGKVGKTVYSRSGRNLPPHRPRKIFNRDEVIQFEQQGLSIRQIAKKAEVRARYGRPDTPRTFQKFVAAIWNKNSCSSPAPIRRGWPTETSIPIRVPASGDGTAEPVEDEGTGVCSATRSSIRFAPYSPQTWSRLSLAIRREFFRRAASWASLQSWIAHEPLCEIVAPDRNPRLYRIRRLSPQKKYI